MPKKTITSFKDLEVFSQAFLSQYPHGAVVGLRGELGAGKTTFVRKCIEIISSRQGQTSPRVTSPSFVIHQSYHVLVPCVDHFDFYRMESLSDDGLLELGYHEVVEQSRSKKGFVFVEWPEKVSNKSLLELNFEIVFTIEGQQRNAEIVKFCRVSRQNLS